ncbi:MAG: NADH-quinone oxidoreductase subunit J [Candidatus Krumholzibacteriia bacterium]
MERTLFYLFGGLSVLASLWMVTRRNPLTSALSLVVAFVGLAALYAMLDAQLLFVIQLWVYAGAVMVLVLFVIMLLDLRADESRVEALGYGRFVVGAGAAALVAWKAFAVLAGVRGEAPPVSKEFGGVAAIAELLFTRYIVQFEVIGVLLLTVVVAVIVMAKRRF